LEADVHYVKTTCNYLKTLKTDLIKIIHKEVYPIRNAKHQFENSKNRISSDISRLEQKINLSCDILNGEID
jgi:septum formation topological specificity factor MinE